MSHRGRRYRRPQPRLCADREDLARPGGHPMSDTATVWRCEFLAPDGHRISGHTSEGVRDRIVSAVCTRGMDHRPPALDCSCGIHGVPQPEHLALFVKAVECTRAWQILRGDSNGLKYVRIIIVRGELADPVPVVNPIRHRLVPRWGVGATATQPLALDIYGDPPGTLRGSQFTLTGPVVIQTTPGDPECAYRDIFGDIEHHLVPETGVATLLSRRLERYASRRRTDDEWWTA